MVNYLAGSIPIYNSKAFKGVRTACPVHHVDSAHYTLYRGNLIKGPGVNMMVHMFCQVLDNTILIKKFSLSLLMSYFTLKSGKTIKHVVPRTGCPISPRRN